MPNSVKPQKARYMPSIRNSPWAKFTMRITPKIRVSPMLTRAYTPPRSTLATMSCATIPISARSSATDGLPGAGSRQHMAVQPRRSTGPALRALVPGPQRHPLHAEVGELLRPDGDLLAVLPLRHVVLRALGDVLARLVELEAPAVDQAA